MCGSTVSTAAAGGAVVVCASRSRHLAASGGLLLPQVLLNTLLLCGGVLAGVLLLGVSLAWLVTRVSISGQPCISLGADAAAGSAGVVTLCAGGAAGFHRPRAGEPTRSFRR
ncbi:MAG: hypothetical protein IPN27_07480 [Cellvibrionales bacterium]|nr:hypothetical protein [Cellvibrionales bacterium]